MSAFDFFFFSHGYISTEKKKLAFEVLLGNSGLFVVSIIFLGLSWVNFLPQPS